jgi:hypothetical protein
MPSALDAKAVADVEHADVAHLAVLHDRDRVCVIVRLGQAHEERALLRAKVNK